MSNRVSTKTGMANIHVLHDFFWRMAATQLISPSGQTGWRHPKFLQRYSVLPGADAGCERQALLAGRALPHGRRDGPWLIQMFNDPIWRRTVRPLSKPPD